MPTDTEVANKALDLIKPLGQRYSFKTKTLLLKVTDGTTWQIDHMHFRNVMNRLWTAGVVNRFGTGAFRWNLKPDVSWDRDSPFRRQSGAPAIPKPEETEEDNKAGDGKPFGGHTANSQLAKDFLRVRDMLVAAQERNKQLVKELDSGTVIWNQQKEAMTDLQRQLAEAGQKVRTIHVHYHDGTKVKLKGKVLPKTFDRVKELAECRRNILLVGPAGSGKSYLAKLVADVLKLEFGSLSCTAGMSEAHILGRSVPDLTHGKNRYQGTDFIRLYEGGGVMLLDEFDAADPNLLLCINTGLANGYLNVPNRPDNARADRHKDFVCIATANTMGRGATRMYAGRNQLDEATLDRFRIGLVEVDYDHLIEAAVCPDIGGEDGRSWLPESNGHDQKDRTIEALVARGYNLRQTCQFIRHKIEGSGMRRIMSTRFLEDSYVMMNLAKWDMRKVLEAYFSGWSPEEKAKVC